jgi:hypothetical protein
MSPTLPRTSPSLLPLKKHCTLLEIHLKEVKIVMYSRRVFAESHNYLTLLPYEVEYRNYKVEVTAMQIPKLLTNFSFKLCH